MIDSHQNIPYFLHLLIIRCLRYILPKGYYKSNSSSLTFMTVLS